LRAEPVYEKSVRCVSELFFRDASERAAILPEQKQRERGDNDAQRQAG